jgi:AAHS family 4-hydroxybenzoate transporter-like MFS transporter
VQGNRVDIEQIIDRNRLGAYRIVIVALCGMVSMVDGFDTQSIAFVAPVIAASWNVPVAQFGPVFGVGLFGGLVGAMIFGAVGDRYGRRVVLLSSIALFAAVSLSTVLCISIGQLILWRFVTGLGLGGAIPSVIAITSEYAPKARRSTVVTLMFCGFPLGAVLGGAISAALIPAYGWHAVFYLGAAAPLVLLPLVLAFVPESIRFLIARRAPPETIARILRRIDREARIPERADYIAADRRDPGFGVRHLFTEGRAAGTVLLWLTFAMSLMLAFFLVNWMPVVFRQFGFPIASAVMATVVLNAGAIVGSIVLARLVDRFGPHVVIGPSFAIGTGFVALIGMLPGPLALALANVFFAGFFSIGAQLTAVSVAAVFYPTSVRATGIGWSMGVGRIGAIAGPVIGGVLIGAGIAVSGIFLVAAAASIVAGGAILTMRLTAPRQSLTRSALSS